MFFIFYSPVTWDPNVIEIVRNVELYQTVFEISDSRWICSTVKLRGSAALELFLQSWSSAKHAHSGGERRERETQTPTKGRSVAWVAWGVWVK
jgi:hypothetical protein